MTYVIERSVDTNTPGSGVQSVHDDGRLVVTHGGRSVVFDTSAGVARVVADTHQQSVNLTEIPEEILEHILHIGYRIHGDNIDDGEFTLLRGDER